MCTVQFQRKFDKFVSLATLKEHKDSELAGDYGKVHSTTPLPSCVMHIARARMGWSEVFD